MEFREPVPRDLMSLKEIHDACLPLKYEEDYFRRMTTRNPHPSAQPRVNLVCCDGDKMIGAITSRIEELCECDEKHLIDVRLHDARLLHITTLVVDPSVRRQGVGQELVQRAIQKARDSFSNLFAVFLHVWDVNMPAIQFYDRLHFQSVAHYKDFYEINGKNEGAYLYVCYFEDKAKPSVHHPWWKELFYESILLSKTFKKDLITCFYSEDRLC